MIQANMHEAKTRLSQLIERAEAGEEVIIARRGKPVVRLQLISPQDASPVEDDEGPMIGNLTWAEWKALDREIEADFEASINTPFPDAELQLPPSAEEMDRIRQLPPDQLFAELVIRP